MLKVLKKSLYCFFGTIIVEGIALFSGIDGLFKFNIIDFMSENRPWSLLVPPWSYLMIISVLINTFFIIFSIFMYIEYRVAEDKNKNINDNMSALTNHSKDKGKDEPIIIQKTYPKETEMKAIDDFIQDTNNVLNLLMKTNKNDEEKTINSHEQQFKKMKDSYLKNINIIELPLSQFISKIQFYDCTNKPLNIIFNKPTLQSLYDSFRGSWIDCWNPYDPNDTKNKIIEKFDKIKIILNRFKNDLNSDSYSS